MNENLPTEFNVAELGFDDVPTIVDTTVTTPEKVESTNQDKTVLKEDIIKEVDVSASPDTSSIQEVKTPTPPSDFEGQTSIQRSIRNELFATKTARDAAETEEEKSVLSAHMKELRYNLAAASKQPQVETTPSQEVLKENQEENQDQPEEETAVRKALEKLGYVDKKTVENMVAELVKTQQAQVDHSKAITDFYSTRPDIASSKENKQIMEDFVIQNFNITQNTTAAQLKVHLDMAASYLFPKGQKFSGAKSSGIARDIVSTSSNTKSSSTAKLGDTEINSLKELGWSDSDIETLG